jgi:hypothetical protein
MKMTFLATFLPTFLPAFLSTFLRPSKRRQATALFGAACLFSFFGSFIFQQIWPNPHSFADHVDILSRIPLAQRTGPDPFALTDKYTHIADGAPPTIEQFGEPNTTELKGEIIVTVEKGDLMDDSVSAIRYRFAIQKKSAGQWEITKAGQQYRCDRGHSNGQFGWAASVCS